MHFSSPLRALTWLHRWSGIFFCLLFAMWFASGAVMLFVPFPSLSAAQRLAHSERIDLSQVRIAPAAVLAQAPHATSLKLISNATQPVYVLTEAGRLMAINASDGRPRPFLSGSAAQNIAEQFSGRRVTRIDTVDYDQWIVHQAFDAGRPYWRATLDNDATLYVSARSGEVLQYTTHTQRMLNMLGAVVHWIYFTPVRAHWALWDQLVWWLSLLALFGAAIGMVLGMVRFIQARRRQRPGLQAFKNWLRWHHVLGLFAGIFLLGWIISGWLSMDHGRLFSRGSAPAEQRAQFQGRDLAQIAADLPLATLQRLTPLSATEIQFKAIAARSFLLAQNGQAARLQFADGVTADAIDAQLLLQAGQAAWPAAQLTLSMPTADLYARAEETPVDAMQLQVMDTQRASVNVYVDAHSGDILAMVDASRRAYAWWYYALHTYEFPGLAEHGTLRIGLMLLLLSAGFALSVTGVVIAVKYLRRH